MHMDEVGEKTMYYWSGYSKQYETAQKQLSYLIMNWLEGDLISYIIFSHGWVPMYVGENF